MNAKELAKNPENKPKSEYNGVKTESLIEQKKDDLSLQLITAPLRGKIYYNLSGEITEPPRVGDIVYSGERICFLQTNYFMNEIICQFNGEIAEIVVHQGDSVNKGEVLFTIREKQELSKKKKKP